MSTNKITKVVTCTWHSYLYDEDKTPKQLTQELCNLDRETHFCWCLCHYPNYIIIKDKCGNCGHKPNIFVLIQNTWTAEHDLSN